MSSAPCIARAAISISGTKKSPRSNRAPDLLERGDQGVVEHRLGLELIVEPALDELAHLGCVADERVVVEAPEDLFVGHAAPRS